MIPRYTRPEMARIWSREHRYEIFLEIELAVLEAFVEKGMLRPDEFEKIRSSVRIDLEDIDERERKTRHDIIAFVESLAEPLGELGRFIHLGLTSSDILDTATGVQIKESGELLLQGLTRLCTALKEKALTYKKTPCIGRTHGVHAEPYTLGLKFLRWYAEILRQKNRLEYALKECAVGKISGAVGTFSHVSPDVETFVCRKLGIRPEPVASQIVHRDRHATYILTLALIGASLENIALEIRHLQRTEVHEFEEPFTKGQKGSSAMPHKKNPILSERICGMARLLRGFAITALENVALWHERDISHSSTERIILPDASILVDYMLDKTAWMIENLQVFPENMQKNLDLTRGLPFSSGILVELLKRGVPRTKAYELVQRNAMKAWNEQRSFLECLESDKEVLQWLSRDELCTLFSMDAYLSSIDFIYNRVLNGDEP